MPPIITSLETLGDNVASLYTILEQPPLLAPPKSCTQTYTFFRVEMVKKVFGRLGLGRSHYHNGLVAEHFVHARNMIAYLLAFMFSRAMCEGFQETWSISMVVPILKLGDWSLPTNYRTILVGHMLAKLYA